MIESKQCSFGALEDVTGHPQCSQPVRWVSTFDGRFTELVWCDEHKPDQTQILSNSRHGVEPIPKLTITPEGHAEKLWSSSKSYLRAIAGAQREIQASNKVKAVILLFWLACSVMIVMAGCTSRGGWPRFLRPGEKSDAEMKHFNATHRVGTNGGWELNKP